MMVYGNTSRTTLKEERKQTKLDVVGITSIAYQWLLGDSSGNIPEAFLLLSSVSPFFLNFLSKPVEALDPPTFFLSTKWSFF